MPNIEERLRSATFPTTRKGLDPEAVTSFLATIADAVATLEDEARAEGVRVRRLERQLTELQSIDGDPSAVFLSASEAKERLLSEARTRAEQILADARTASRVSSASQDPVARALEEAAIIETAAREVAEQILADARRRATEIQGGTGSLPTEHTVPDPETLQQYG